MPTPGLPHREVLSRPVPGDATAALFAGQPVRLPRDPDPVLVVHVAAEAFREAAQVRDGGAGEADSAVAQVSDAFGLGERGEPGGVGPVHLGGVRDVGAGSLFQGEQDVPVAGVIEDGPHGLLDTQKSGVHLVVGEDAAGAGSGVREPGSRTGRDDVADRIATGEPVVHAYVHDLRGIAPLACEEEPPLLQQSRERPVDDGHVHVPSSGGGGHFPRQRPPPGTARPPVLPRG